MAEKRRGKKRKEGYVEPGEDVAEKPSKDEITIAKWLRKNVPIKKTKFLNHNVEYFTGKRAVDALLESQFCKRDEPLFKTREDIIDFLDLMLEHKFFHRARKVPISESELRGGKKKDKNKDKDSSDDKEKKVEKEKNTDAESSVVEGKQEKGVAKDKKKKKIRLDMHNDQRFVDSLDAYVWIFDPIPFHYWIIGTLVVLGGIGLCLFPLWPPSVRVLVYYLSVAAAGFLVTIIMLAVLRLIFFCLVWAVTMGRHHIWILPNLTEDVGFFASFWPLYTYEYRADGKAPSKKKKDKKKAKDSDNEDEVDDKVKKSSLEDNDTERQDDGEKEESQVENVNQNPSESESESSQRSSTGKDFEMVGEQDLDS